MIPFAALTSFTSNPTASASRFRTSPRLPYLVLAIGVAATVFGTFVVHRIVQQQSRNAFEADIDRAQATIEKRVASYVDLVRSTGQIFYLTEFAGPPTFYKYVEGLDLKNNYRGIRALGTTVRLPRDPAFRAKFVAQAKAYEPTYRLWPSSKRADYHTIVALFPRDKQNMRALGYDMHTEPVRADAMDRARDSARPAASGRVVLVQDEPEDSQPGFLIYAPLYANGVIPSTLAERDRNLIGYTYAPLRMRDVFEGIFPLEGDHSARFDVRDISGGRRDDVLFRSWQDLPTSKVADETPLARSFSILVADRTWRFTFWAPPGYHSATGTALTVMTAVACSAVALLLFGITLYQNRNHRALEQRQRSIEVLNEQLQRAMRETHHRVKNNLQVITAMIDMQAIEADPAIEPELRRLSMHVMGLATVHDILTNQARAAGDTEHISAEAILQRLVPMLEPMALGRPLVCQVEDATLSSRQGTSLAIVTNELVSNAIKHGRGAVEIRFFVDGGVGVLDVADNGPGFPANFEAAQASRTGLQLVENLSVWDLGGGVQFQNRVKGGAQVIVNLALESQRKIGKKDLTN
jgi:CHASE1-domain containing sensor protein/two-component sensor histidine kinase